MRWRYRHTVLILAVLANFTQVGSRLAISPVVPAIIESFAISKSAIGIALTGMWAMNAVLQFPSGVFSDRFGERPVVLAALGLTGLGSLLLAASPTFPFFAVFAVFLGIGSGLYFSVGSSLLTKLFPNTGGALGVHASGGLLSGLLMPVAAGFIGVRYGWRPAIVIGAVLALPAFALVRWRIRPTPPMDPETRLHDRFDPAVIVDLLSRPMVAFTIVLAVIGNFTFQAIASFFPTFLIEFHGFTTTDASIAFGAIFFLGAIVQPAVGRVSDTVGRDTVLSVNFLVATIGIGLVLLAPVRAVALIGVGFIGLGMTWFAVLQARIMDGLSDAERGAGFGLARTIFAVIAASGSAITGILADVSGWPAAYGLVAALLMLAFVSIVVNRAMRLGL